MPYEDILAGFGEKQTESSSDDFSNLKTFGESELQEIPEVDPGILETTGKMIKSFFSEAPDKPIKGIKEEDLDRYLQEHPENIIKIPEDIKNDPAKMEALRESFEPGVEPALEQAWNPAEIFAGIYAGGLKAAVGIGKLGFKAAAKSAAIQATVGTTADIPIHLAGEKLREEYGWGPGLAGELALSFASGASIERFIENRISSIGSKIGTLDKLAQQSGEVQEETMRTLDNLLSVAQDRARIISPRVPDLEIGRPIRLEELDNIPQIKLQEKSAEAVAMDVIRKADGTPYGSEKTARAAIKRKKLSENFQPKEVSDGWVIQGPRFEDSATRRAVHRNLAEEKIGDELPDERVIQMKNAARAEYVRAGEPDKGKIIEDLIKANTKTEDLITPADRFVDDTNEILNAGRVKKIEDLEDLEGPSIEELKAIEEVTEKELIRNAEDLGIPDKTPKRIEQAIKVQKKAQDDIEEFLGKSLENFSDGYIRRGLSDEIGFSDDVRLSEERLLMDDELLGSEDSARDLGDFFKDLTTVIGGKVGLGIEDVARLADRDSTEAAMRLMKDLAVHHAEATKKGISFFDFMLEKGFSEDVAKKLENYYNLMMTRGEEATQKALSVEEIDANIVKSFKGILPKFAIEVPFRQLGTPETGFAIKTHFSTQGLFEDEGKKIISRLSNRFRHFDETDWGKVTLKAEDKNYDLGDVSPGKAEDIEKAAQEVREYLDKSAEELTRIGVFKQKFPESYTARQEKLIAKYEDKLNSVSQPAAKKKYEKKLLAAKENLKNVEGIDYVPALGWLDGLAEKNPSRFSKIAKILNQRQRNIPSVRYLLDNDYISPEDIDIRNLIGHYARRKGKDMANQRLKNALENDGLIRKIPKRKGKDFPHHWAEIDKTAIPMLKDYVAHPRIAEYLKSYYGNIGRGSAFDRALNVAKIAQFVNPTIMPMYDTYQSVVLHGVNSWKLPKNIADGIKSVLKQDQDFRDLSWYGGYSKPFESPLKAWEEDIANAKLPLSKRFKRFFNPMPVEMGKNVYNLSFDMAWTGDRMIRMASYKELRRQGLGKKEAAQLTALFHGDYASVPPGTRKWLNRAFFTPTFKIVMTQWQASMAKAVVKEARTGFRTDQKNKILAKGMIGLFALNFAKDKLMTGMGFERDEWGRRYYQEVETPEGMKEVVIPFSDPTNILLKYMYRAYQATRPGGDTFMKNIWNGLKFDIHPTYRIIGFDMMNNEKLEGGQIYSFGDSKDIKVLKSMRYFIEQSVPLIDKVEGAFGVETKEEEKERKIIEKEFGQIGKNILNTIAFTYIREPKRKRLKFKIDKIRGNIYQDAFRGNLTRDRLRNYQEQLREIQNEMLED